MTPRDPIILDSTGPLDAAIETLKSGNVIAYPTETFYGLGADAVSARALERIFALKGRSIGKPVSILVEDESMLASVVAGIPALARPLMERFWPGPLTIVFLASAKLPKLLTGDTGKIGVRVSSNPVAARLLREFGFPITATSANPAGRPAPVLAKEAFDYFGGRLDVIIDGGRLVGRLGSTIIDVTGKGIKLIRPGDIGEDEVMKCAGRAMEDRPGDDSSASK